MFLDKIENAKTCRTLEKQRENLTLPLFPSTRFLLGHSVFYYWQKNTRDAVLLWLVPRKRPSHYAIALSGWVSVIRVLIVFPDSDTTPWSVYFGLYNYFRSLCNRLINLPLPYDCWNLPYLPLFVIVYSTITTLPRVHLLWPYSLLCPCIYTKKSGLFIHVGSNVKIKMSIVLWF